MRAWRAHRPGEPADVLVLDHVDPPAPAPQQVRLRVHAAGVNFADALLCRGTYQDQPDPPVTPGLEVVGTVEAVGTAVDEQLLGRRALAPTALPHGGWADAALAAADDLLPLPDELDAATGVALHVTYQTAWVGLHHRARLDAGETVVVHAAAGATGSAFVQVARAAGARVLATAGGPDKVRRCLEIGAHAAADSRDPSVDLVAWVRDDTAGRGADVVIDPVGGPLATASRRCLGFEGRLVLVGFASGEVPELPANHLLVKNLDVVGLQWPAYRTHRPEVVRTAHDALLDLLRRGAITPLLAEPRPLSDAPAAIGDVLARRTEGKLVLEP